MAYYKRRYVNKSFRYYGRRAQFYGRRFVGRSRSAFRFFRGRAKSSWANMLKWRFKNVAMYAIVILGIILLVGFVANRVPGVRTLIARVRSQMGTGSIS